MSMRLRLLHESVTSASFLVWIFVFIFKNFTIVIVADSRCAVPTTSGDGTGGIEMLSSNGCRRGLSAPNTCTKPESAYCRLTLRQLVDKTSVRQVHKESRSLALSQPVPRRCHTRIDRALLLRGNA